MTATIYLLAGVLLGSALGVFLGWLYRTEKVRGKTCLFTLYGDGEIGEKWVKDPTKTKINGRPTMPTLNAQYRHSYRTRPAYLLDEKTGNCLRVTHDPSRMKEAAERQEAGFVWPDAYDTAIMYSDGRAEKVAQSQLDDRANWAKIGAVVGLIVGALVMIALVMVMRVARQVGVQ